MKCYLTMFFVLCFSLVSAFCETVNTPAPDFKLQEYGTENSVALSSLVDNKNIIILNFFDSHCEPCKKEIPKLNTLSKKHANLAKIYMVCLDEKPENVMPEYLKQNKVEIPILSDPLGYRAGEKYGVIKFGAAEIPQLFVIGKDGRVHRHYKGYHEDIEELLSKDITELSAQTYVKPKETAIEIVYAGSSNGLLESCDCPQNPFGGIVRKVAALNKIKSDNPDAILLDSGDYLPPRPDKVLAEYSCNMIKMIAYDMISVGDQEILQGIDYLKDKAKEIPFYSSNLTTCDDKMCYPFNKDRYIIKKVGDVKIGIISVLNPEIFFLFPKDKLKDVKILNMMEYLKDIIPGIKKEADIVVLVSHCGDEQDNKIAQDIEGIDLIIGGHSQTFNKIPLKVNNTLIVQGGQNSHRVGIIKFKLGDKKQILSYSNDFVLLNKDIAGDPKAVVLLEKYKKELKEKAKELVK